MSELLGSGDVLLPKSQQGRDGWPTMRRTCFSYPAASPSVAGRSASGHAGPGVGNLSGMTANAPERQPGGTDLPLVVHVHSRYSDGTATIPEILAAARAAGAGGVLLTDHDTLAARRDGWEGWHDGVLLVVGHEVSPRGGHLLVFGPGAEISHAGRSEEEICRAAAQAGALAFAAHPFSAGSAMAPRIAPPHPWRALDACPALGIELWSLATDVAEGWRSPREAWRFLRAPEALIDGPPAWHLAAWDALGARRRVPALGGLDAHQPGARIGSRVLSPMPNARWFALLQTHVLLASPLTGRPEPDIAAVLDALAAGRAYLACEALGPAAGFSFRAVGDAGELPMGAEADAGEWRLELRMPRPAALRLLRDGAVVRETSSAESLTAPATGPGVYRAEARRGGRLWVLSNAIYLR